MILKLISYDYLYLGQMTKNRSIGLLQLIDFVETSFLFDKTIWKYYTWALINKVREDRSTYTVWIFVLVNASNICICSSV